MVSLHGLHEARADHHHKPLAPAPGLHQCLQPGSKHLARLLAPQQCIRVVHELASHLLYDRRSVDLTADLAWGSSWVSGWPGNPSSPWCCPRVGHVLGLRMGLHPISALMPCVEKLLVSGWPGSASCPWGEETRPDLVSKQTHTWSPDPRQEPHPEPGYQTKDEMAAWLSAGEHWLRAPAAQPTTTAASRRLQPFGRGSARQSAWATPMQPRTARTPKFQPCPSCSRLD